MKITNITFIGLNYAPEDTAIGLYSTQWAEYLKSVGYEVTVVTAFPYYPKWEISKTYKDKKTFLKEELNGNTILRYKQYVPKKPTFLKRVIHLIDFTFGSFINILKIKNCDLVISVVPFTSSIFLGYILKKKFNAKLWVHIQDFEFDAALQTGVSEKKNIIFSSLFSIEKWLLSKANLASTISYSMMERLKKKTESKAYFLPNWIDEKAIDPKQSSIHRYLNSRKIKILYSGNIGDKQDWDAFLKFCNDINPEKYDVIIVGNGSKKDWLLQKTENFKNIKYYNPVPFNELSDLLCSTDIHVLFQKTEVVDTVMPSKVLGMIASTKPSIIIGNNKSEVKSIIMASKGGLFFSEYSKDVVHDLELLLSDKERLEMNGNLAREFVIENFSKTKILNRMLDKLKQL
ncbi:WcaI family glycosyltransferase [Winogradskyella sp. SYSU M77433]|uniref:WcaI family glycosyltransferase n=1 Tax=Winogradskyella sp. SYSU M77433 TaxID=3042722 RepID=UPI002480F041|nr:WcaI family glycosyltransferase [Winogradskyella sp. SYSU M77433]MDH7913704.1 WcaI family glycosyltransferase [Winogradskyella sp. SYSU M77433]